MTRRATGIAAGVMLNCASPIPTSNASTAGSDAISPHTDSGTFRLAAALPDMANESEYRRMQRLVEMRHALIGAIDGKTALNQVVRADGQKVALSREQVRRECGRRHFDHDADPERPGRRSPRLNLLTRLGQDASCLAQLFDPRHERKHHAQIAVRRRAHQRAQLRRGEARGVSA